MRAVDSAFDNGAAESAEAAEHVIDTAGAQPGDAVEYESWEGLDDMGRDTILRRLAQRDLTLYDDSCEMQVVWMYALDGSRLDSESDDVRSAKQPATSVGPEVA